MKQGPLPGPLCSEASSPARQLLASAFESEEAVKRVSETVGDLKQSVANGGSSRISPEDATRISEAIGGTTRSASTRTSSSSSLSAASLTPLATAAAPVPAPLHVAALAASPTCADGAHITKLVCYTHPDTHNLVAIWYGSSGGADDQVCSSCIGCNSQTVPMGDGEYPVVLAAYKAAAGLATAGLLVITNMGQFLFCGDGLAQANGATKWGPEVAPGGVATSAGALLAASSLGGICALSASAPYLQRLTRVCFSARESIDELLFIVVCCDTMLCELKVNLH